jgi:maltose alpha-D-glucosyltransferase/alpha-amylase
VQGMLSLFELEKVLYELRYEINNRPAWVPVPLSGLMGILGGAR